MSGPSVEPTVLTFRAAPGEARSANLTITNAPADEGITATVVAGGAPVAIESVVVYEQVIRPFTEEEIEQLPPFPPSIREKAREEGGPVTEETGRSDGSTPLRASAGATLVVTLVMTSETTSNRSGTATGATVHVDGASMPRIEVPVVVLSGTATTIATYVPAALREPAEPGEVVRRSVQIHRAPAPATVVAFLAHDDSIVRVAHVAASEAVRRMFTEEELAELPPFPPSIREEARETGYIEYHETRRADANTSLAVSAGDLVQVFLEISPPAAGAPFITTNTLVIESTGWQRIEVPIEVVIGHMEAVLSAESVDVRQGESGAVDLTLTSRAGPGTDVRLRLGRPGDPFHVTPAVVHVPSGRSVTSRLQLSADPEVYLSTYPLGLEVRSFDIHTRQLTLDVTLVPGAVTVTAPQPSMVGLQGERATSSVQVTVGGGRKRLTFEPRSLPVGIRMGPLELPITGPGTAVVPLDFVVDPAVRPVVDEPITVAWSANDGIHAGVLNLSLTVLLRPETVTFSQPVVTPAGTPLGGHVDMVLHNDGSGAFRGHMRATGFFSYRFRVRSVVRSADGRVAVMAQKSGAVYGTDTPGNRQFDWDDDARSPFAADQWAAVRTGSMVVNKSYEMAGVLGTLADLAVDVVEFIAAAALLNPVSGGLAGVILVGSELAELTGARVVGPGGLVGLVATVGGSVLFGPGVIIPVLVGGAVIGEAAVEHRGLTDAERSLATEVFGDTLPLDRIVLTNLSGERGQEFVAPNIDGSILVNLGSGFGSPLTHKDPRRGYTQDGQIFVHELTHAWQVANSDVISEYFWRAAVDAIGGSASYRYGPPGPPWSSFGLEQQASIVEEWFSATQHRATAPVAGRPTERPPRPDDQMRTDDPYFRYIADDIRLAGA